jgi:hypothetical protein
MRPSIEGEIFRNNLPISLESGAGASERARCSRSEHPHTDLTQQRRTAQPRFDMTDGIILDLMCGRGIDRKRSLVARPAWVVD